MTKMNREQWLMEMVNFFAPEFERLGYSLKNKKIGVSVGFPSSRAKVANRRIIGEVWSNTCSVHGYYQIFISPVIKDSIQAASTLLHELVHIAVGIGQGHRKVFRKCAIAVGLCGQMRSTVAGQKLIDTLQTLISILGEIPHGELIVSTRPHQSTRMHKVVCPDCGYTVRISKAWLQKGTPTCVCGYKMEEISSENSLQGQLV